MSISNAVSVSRRTLTDLDHVRISNLLQRQRRDTGASAAEDLPLDELLDNADVVPARQVSPDVVTMYSQVLVQDVESGQRSEITVCYPPDAEPGSGFVSVLSPVGSGLLGLRVGNTARWSSPTGAQKTAEILAILFQPESSNDFTT